MIQHHLKDEVRKLAISHPIPHEGKLEHRLKTLARLQTYYEKRRPEVSEEQARVFRELILAATYAITMIKMYRKVAKRLAELAPEEGNNDETNRLNSES